MEYGALLGLLILAVHIIMIIFGVLDWKAWKGGKQTFTRWVEKRAIWIAWVLVIETGVLSVWMFFHWNLLGSREWLYSL